MGDTLVANTDPMSFRRRLTLFFLLIVIVPIISFGVVIYVLVADNETGKADAKVAEGQTAAVGLYRDFTDRAGRSVPRVSGDSVLAAAVRTRDAQTATARARTLVRNLRLRRVAVDVDGRRLVDVGDRRAVAPSRHRLVGSRGNSVGQLEVSTVIASDYAALARKVTGLDVVVAEGARVLATTLPGVQARNLPSAVDTVDIGENSYRIASVSAPSFGPAPLRISVVSDAGATFSAISTRRLLAAVALVVFLLLAFAFALAVSRALQAQIARLLEAAQRLGGGDFSTRVPTEGNDEFAALGEEFNKMSGQLKARIDELARERGRLEESVRRLSETFASNLDRQGLLEIVVRTAVDALDAGYGRASAREADGHMQERVSAGQPGSFGSAIAAAESAALKSRRPEDASAGGCHALSVPLTPADERDQVLGLVSIARSGRRFSADERELFAYLAAQAAVSIENVGLHELVQRQAVTDELTGLFNHRRFQEVIVSEVERARRFSQELGLIMLDIDDFKQVNDTYGHQQGDLVLHEVARVVAENSREIDEPARYGGEEFAIALPQTDLEGAYNLAERMRTAIQGLTIPSLAGDGELRITASLGVAALPECAEDKDGLIAAADVSLYQAKRAGKNRTERPPSLNPQDGSS